MKKEFLLDNDGNIADCESNIAKMNNIINARMDVS